MPASTRRRADPAAGCPVLLVHDHGTPMPLRMFPRRGNPYQPPLSFFDAGCAKGSFRRLLVGRSAVATVLLVAMFAPASQAPRRLLAQESGAEISADTREKLYELLRQREGELERQMSLLKTVVRLVRPTVVHIETEKDERSTSRFGGRRIIEEAGSGVVIQLNDRFYVLTNWHVIRNAPAEAIKIEFSDGRELTPASKSEIWHDAETDIAVIRVTATDLIAARLGDSDKLEIGDFVLAVGSPFGLSHSVTYGIVSAKGRRDLELGDEGVKYQDFLQTDAAINPGNSGGPLINLRGEVVGINTAIASNSGGNEGIGFSIPINMVMTIARQLVAKGAVVRAYLGVRLEQKFNAAEAARHGLSRPRGALINFITPNSPAEAANLRAGDVILRFNGIPVESDAHLINLVSLVEVDREVPLVIYRGKQEMTIMVKVGNRNQFEPRTEINPPPETGPEAQLGLNDVDSWEIESLGLRVVTLDQTLVDKLQLKHRPAGLLVVSVDGHGPAWGRIQPGDVIDQAEDRPVSTVRDFERTLSRIDFSKGLRVRVRSARSERAAPRHLIIKPLREPRSARPEQPGVRQASLN